MPPQPHTSGFKVVPDTSAHAGAWLQVLVAASHIMPVLESHAAVPQTQMMEELCGAEPSWWSQARAVTEHKHANGWLGIPNPQFFGEFVLELKEKFGSAGVSESILEV